MTRICIFGDSITHGKLDLDNGGWVKRLRQWFERLDRFNALFNLGIPGDTSESILRRIDSECKSRLKTEYKKENVILIQIGINDSRYSEVPGNFNVPPKTFKENLKSIIKICRKFSEKIIVLGLTPVDESRVQPIPWNPTEYYTNENVNKYNSIIKSVSEETGIYFIDVLTKLDINLLKDGLHPNSEGHQKIFEIVKDFLIENKII